MVKLLEGESRTPEFRETVSSVGKIPVLKGDDFVLTESHAILIYLAEKHGWDLWYPKDLKTQARVGPHLPRCLFFVYTQTVRVPLDPQVYELAPLEHAFVVGNDHEPRPRQPRYLLPEIEGHIANEPKAIENMLRILEVWLRDGNEYLATQSHASLADLSCYNGAVQLEAIGLLGDVDAKFPKVSAWLKRMKEIPHHDEQLAAIMRVFAKYKMIPSANT